MKNSLFKRAIAAVATVPLALTQCLGVANAATVEDSALSLKETGSVKADDSSNKTITLTGKGGVLYITLMRNLQSRTSSRRQDIHSGFSMECKGLHSSFKC